MMTILCAVDGRPAEIEGGDANFPADCIADPQHNICDLHAELDPKTHQWICPVCKKAREEGPLPDSNRTP